MNIQDLKTLKENVTYDRVSYLEDLTVVKWAMSSCNNYGIYVDHGILFGIEYNMYKLTKELFLDCVELIIYNREKVNKLKKMELMYQIAHRFNTGLT